MNKKYLSVTVILFVLSINSFAQNVDLDKIDIEYKDPIKVLGLENDDLYFNFPVQVKFNPVDHKIYVADKNNHRIVVLDEELNYITEFGRLGQGPVEFERPSGIEFDTHNNLIITDNYNHRVQILDQNFNCLSIFFIGKLPDDESNAKIDLKDRIYLNFPTDKTLFAVYDMEGKKQCQFGEIIEDKNKFFQKLDNIVRFIIDNDELYCAYFNKPILRKYDADHRLIYEINNDYLPEIKYRIKEIKELARRKKQPYVHYANYLITGISVDENYLYIGIWGQENTNVYVFNKINGTIIKKIIFNYDGNPARIEHPEFSSNKYIYAIDKLTHVLLMYKK